MRLLFAITVCSFLAVLWVALALARRVRLGHGTDFRPKRRPFARQEFFEAGEFRTPRPLRLDQEIFQQRPRRSLSEISLAAARQTPAPARSAGPDRKRYASAVASPRGSGPVPVPLSAGRDAQVRFAAPRAADGNVLPKAAPAPIAFTGHRIPPQSERLSGLRRRVDLSNFNTEMGDLTDPSYNQPQRGSGTRGPVPVHRRIR